MFSSTIISRDIHPPIGVAEQGRITREEFCNGVMGLGCDTLDKLRARVSQLQQDIKPTNKFKDFYQYAFHFAKDSGTKNLG